MKRLCLVLAVAAAAVLHGYSEAPALPDDPCPVIGQGLAEVFAARGIPDGVSTVRGPTEWQDDVVFLFRDGTSYWWFENRVWRLSFGKPYAGSVFGVRIGDDRDRALSLLGQPHYEAAEGLVWRLPWKGYPVELSIRILDGKVAEIAVFRADL